MTATAVAPVPAVVDVVVKLGEHVIAHWTGPELEAPRIVAAWEHRFGLKVTVTPVRAGVEWT